MNTDILNQKGFVFIVISILMVTFGTQSISYAQEANPTITASAEELLTEATLHESVVTLTLSAGQFTNSEWDIGDALTMSGIDGVTFEWYYVDRVSDNEVTIELEFAGNIDTNATLTFTVEAEAITGYDGNALTATLPVTAVEESLEASTAAPLTEATLHGSVITLILNGRQFIDSEWSIARAVSVSGIEGVTIGLWDVERVSDTEVAVKFRFNGTDFDTDATLTFTVGADAIAGYNQELTGEVSVTAIQKSNATVSISPASIISSDIGEVLTFSLNIKGGANVAGYQATVLFDNTALDYVRSANSDYLPIDAFFMDQSFYRAVRLTTTTLAGAANGAGTLATLTFEVEDFKASTLTLSEVYLVDADGTRWEVTTESAEVTIPPEPEKAILGDINRDGVVNIQDLVIVNVRFGQTGENSADINGDRIVNIVDLVSIAGAFGNGAAAPALYSQSLERLTAADIQRWLSQAQQLKLTDATSLRGILFLEQLLAALIPKETVLLVNYPNPFNPETWIPYRLSKPADVTLTIYAVDGQMARRLSLGHQSAGIYQSRSRAAYWDGKNKFGEPVASGLYFYTLTAGDFTATRKMLVRK
ncbi:MAG: T9SS type A sorting domain-containing protein [Candidatus Poribacteria bacterium]|nr:T9SS type A sorting domain-containing protein [Candidatus Poribacteria bacterium]